MSATEDDVKTPDNDVFVMLSELYSGMNKTSWHFTPTREKKNFKNIIFAHHFIVA